MTYKDHADDIKLASGSTNMACKSSTPQRKAKVDIPIEEQQFAVHLLAPAAWATIQRLPSSIRTIAPTT